MAYDIGPKIGIEGEKEFRKAIKDINTSMWTLKSEMKLVSSEFDKGDKSQEAYTAKNKVLNKQIDTQNQKLKELEKGLKAASDKYGENDSVTQKWKQAVNKANAELNNLERELDSNIKAMDNFGDEMDDVKTKSGKFSKALGGVGDGLKGIGKGIGKAAIFGVQAVGAAAIAGATGLVAMTENTKEYRKELSMLEQNAKDSGNSMENMKEQLSDMTALTGDSGAAVEGLSNLMATGFDDDQITSTVDALSGAVVKFPDTLKFESLADGLQETLATGKAIGPFSELIDRMGGDVDAFNEALAGATTEAERQQVALDWLSKSGLSEVSAEYKETNKAALDAAEAQFKMNDSMASLSDVVEPAIATLKGGAADMMSSLVGVVLGTEGATEDFKKSVSAFATNAIGMVEDLIPTISTTMQALIPVVVQSITDALPMLGEAATAIILLLITELVGALPDLIPVAADIILTLLDGITNAMPELIPVVLEIMDTIIDTFVELAPKLIPMGMKFQVELAKGLIQAIPKLLEAIPEIISAILFGLISGIPEILGFIPQLFGDMGEKIADIDWAQLGKDMINGIVSGIKSVGSNIKDSVSDAAGGAVSWAKKKLKIQSPSKVFKEEVGEMIGLGMAEGISDSARKVEGAMQGLNGKLGVNRGISVNAGGLAAISKIEHAGIITVRGVNNENQLMGVAEIVMDHLRRESRS